MALRVASLDYLGIVAARLRKDALSSQLNQETVDEILQNVSVSFVIPIFSVVVTARSNEKTARVADLSHADCTSWFCRENHRVQSVERGSDTKPRKISCFITKNKDFYDKILDVTSHRACLWRHSYDATPCYCIVFTSWNSGPNFGALETAQQSKGIPEGDPPGQSGISIVGSFLSHGRTEFRGGRIFLRIFLYIIYELAGFNISWQSNPSWS
jgi:hypothetical protein